MTPGDLLQSLSALHQMISMKYISYRRKNADLMGYRFHIFQSYSYVKHTVPILQCLLEKCPQEHSRWLSAHIEDERDHELLFERDLINTGDIPEWPVSPFVLDYVKSAYSLAKTAGGFSGILGDMLLAEGDSPKTKSILMWTTSLGISPNAAQGLLTHAEADCDHRQELIAILHSSAVDLRSTYARLLRTSHSFLAHWDWMQSMSSILRQDQTNYEGHENSAATQQ